MFIEKERNVIVFNISSYFVKSSVVMSFPYPGLRKYSDTLLNCHLHIKRKIEVIARIEIKIGFLCTENKSQCKNWCSTRFHCLPVCFNLR